MNNVEVVAKIIVKKEFIDEVFDEFKILHEKTHKNDAGCLKYDLHKDSEEENVFFFIETWENIEYLGKHEASSHFTDFIIKVEGKLEDINVNKLEKVIL